MDNEKKFLRDFARLIVLICLLYFFAVTFIEIPESAGRYADIILGALIGSGFTAILTFFYGSSEGSSDKNETIQKMIDKG